MITKQKIKHKLLQTGFFNDCNELDQYAFLILSNFNNTKQTGFQIHHWFPKCLSKFVGKPINNSKNNLVKLEYADHIFAHVLLAKSCNDLDLFKKLSTFEKIIESQYRLSSSSKNQLKIDIQQYIKDLNDIYKKKSKIQKESDIKFYVLVNHYLQQGKSYWEIDQILGKERKYTNRRYDIICSRWNLHKQNNSLYSKDENIAFYNQVTKYLQQGQKYQDMSKTLNMSRALIGQRYRFICKKYNLPNTNLNGKSNKNKDLEFYRLANDWLKQGKSLHSLSKIKGHCSNWAGFKYLWICKRYNLQNLCNKSYNKIKKSDKDFYELVNQYLKLGKNFKEIGSLLGKPPKYTGIRYARICNKFGLERMKQNKNIISQSNLNFYKKIYELKNKGLTYKEISKVLGESPRYCETRYLFLCKKYNIPRTKNTMKGIK